LKKDIYAPVDAFGQESKPSLKQYPEIPWDKINLDQFNLVPKMAKRTLQRIGEGWGTFRIIPMESGPEAMAQAVDSLKDKSLGYRINIFIARMCFRGIYFPQMGPWSWLKLIYQNRRTISGFVKEGLSTWRGRPSSPVPVADESLQTRVGAT